MVDLRCGVQRCIVVAGTYIASGDVGAADLLNLIAAPDVPQVEQACNIKLPADHHTSLKLQDVQ
jgi:hypothetical protein